LIFTIWDYTDKGCNQFINNHYLGNTNLPVMKITFSIFLLMFTYGAASAQTGGQPDKVVVRCVASKGSMLNPKPLYVVF